MAKGSVIKYIILLFCALPVFAYAQQERSHAFEVNHRLGRGINIGNTFEAPSETEWGNPWNPEYFKIISDLGFTHVRVPVRWEPSHRSMAVAPYTIYNSFLERIKGVVDEALKNKLHIISICTTMKLCWAIRQGRNNGFLRNGIRLPATSVAIPTAFCLKS